jgi:hypothetical protein
MNYMNKLSEIFMDNDGSLSCSRFVMILYASVIISAWCYVSVKSAALTPVPESVITMLGLSLGAKVLQKPFESKS